MTLALTGYKLHPVHLPYRRPVRWAGHAESGLDVMILTLETAGGLIGVGEAAGRLNWNAATLKSLKVVTEEIFMPRLMGQDLALEAEVTRFLRYVREHALAKAMIDSAVWDQQRVGVMREAVRLKFGARTVLRALLVATHPHPLRSRETASGASTLGTAA